MLEKLLRTEFESFKCRTESVVRYSEVKSGVNALGEMAGGQEFIRCWEALSRPGATASEKTEAYTFLTSYLKETTVAPGFISTLCLHQKPLTRQILGDITPNSSCEHAALQTLGYCLHNPDFAVSFSKEEVTMTVEAVCGVIAQEGTDRNTCTRALWCLANQNFHMSQCSHMVAMVISTVGAAVRSQHYGTPTVDNEALNLLVRLSQQCPLEFIRMAMLWYRPIFHLLLCKVTKLQRRALNLAASFEEKLCDNHELLHWLVKELKEGVVATMVKMLTEKGRDHCLILTIWSHFVTILGKTLHKHGSFLNELLKVVEMGFKHKLFVVQVAAYSAWKTLISNFSRDITLLTSQKRLKLLLMPLLASAVRERHEQVEHARLLTWWHLIGCLGAKRSALFKQICIPFLMFCLGLDPKLDISQLATSINSTTMLNHSHSHTTPTSRPHTTPMSHSNTTPACSTPTAAQTTSIASGISQDRVELSITEQKSFSTSLSLVASPATPRRTPSPNKHSSNRYQSVPSLPMVVSGCHAVLQFLGVGMGQVAQSLIEQELVGDVTFPKLVVPVEVAQFFIIFLDRLLLCSAHYGSLIKGNMVDLVICHLVTTIINTLNQDDHQDLRWSSLPLPLLEMLLSGRLEGHVEENTRKEVISQLCLLPNRILTSVNCSNGMVAWKTLLGELLKSKRIDHNSVWFQGNWKNIVTVATTVPDRLSQFRYLIDKLEELVQPDYLERSSLSSMWSTLANFFTYFIKETSQVNGGTTLDPDFTVARHILRFPFQQILMSVTKSCVFLAMDTWKALYDVVNIHISLLVKAPNTCAEMICSDLYSAYGQNAKVDASTLDSRGQVIKFDVYQNAVAMALQCVASKLNWSTFWSTSEGRGQMRGGERRGGAVGGERSIRSLMSLLAWQLATFWDNMQKPVINLGQLTTPYTLMDTLSLLYRYFPSSEVVRFATELIAEPLATLWEKILASQLPSLKSRPKPPSDLHEEVAILWKNIMTCFQARYTQPYDSRLLSLLSPLLVVTLSSKKQNIVNPTLNFWSLTFDRAPHLTYPYKLHETFSSYLKGTKSPLQLQLPGFDTSKEVLSIEDSMPTTSVSQFSESESRVHVEERTVVLPNPSPQKGVRGSFLNRLQSPRKPPLPSTPEKSPAAKSMDEILARSRARQAERATNVGNGGSPQRGVKKAAFPVRRKLSLSEEETYVAVTPPAKKRRLLTEHQKEKMRERRDIPTLYNALDPSQDSTQPPLTEDQSLPDSPSGSGDDPIIIPESEVSPATPVSLRRSSVNYQPTLPPHSTTTFSCPPPPPPSSSSTALPPEAMDTNTLSEFPTPISRSDSTPISRPNFVSKPTSTPAPPDNTAATGKNKEVIDVDKTPPLATPTLESAKSMSPHIVTLAPANAAMATHTSSTVTSDIFQPLSHPPHQTDSIREVEGSVQHEPGPLTQPKAYLRLKTQVPTAAVTTSTELYSSVQAPSSSSCVPPKLYHTPQPANHPPRSAPPSLVLVNSNSLSCPQPTQSPVTFNLAASTTTMHQAERSHSFLPVGPKLPSDIAFQRALVAAHASTAVPAVLTHPITHPPVVMTTVPPATGSVPTNITAISSPLLASPTDTRIRENQMNNAILDATVQQLAQQKWCKNDRESSTGHPLVPTPIPTPQVCISPHVSPQMLAGSTPIAFVTVNDNPEYLVVSHDRTCRSDLPTVIHPPVSRSTSTTSGGRRYVSATVVSNRLQGGRSSYPSVVSAQSQPKMVDGSFVTTEGSSTKQSIATVLSNISSAHQQTPTTLPPPPLSTTAPGSKIKLPSSGLEGEKGSAKSTPSLQLKRRGKGRKLASQSASETPSELLQASAEETKVIKKAKKRGYKPKDQGPPEQKQNDEAVLVTEVSEVVRASEAQSLRATTTPLASTTTAAAESSLAQPDTRSQVSCESEDPLVGVSSRSVQNGVTQTAESNNTPSSTTGNTLGNMEVEIIKVEINDVSRTAPDGSDVAAESKSEQQTVGLSEGVSGQEHNLSEEGRLHEDVSPTDVSPTDVSPTEVSKQVESETPSKPSEGCVHDSSPLHQENSKAVQDPTKLDTIPSTPTPENGPIPSPRDTPAGILKRTSQFDTPFSASKSRHVQFASSPVMIDPEEGSKNGGEESFKTPKHRRGSRTPQGTYSSRRTLQMSHTTPTKLILVNKPPSTPPPSSTEPIYPPLASCLSPVEQILPALTPSNRFTHGLVQLAHARNIRTVGNISSLTQQQVQTLPIKSPKVETLKAALKSFEQQLGSKRRPSVEDEVPTTAKQSRACQPSSTSSVDSSEQPNGGPQDKKVCEKTTANLSTTDSQDLLGSESSVPTESAVMLSTPDSQLVPEAKLKNSVSEESSNKAGKVAPEQSGDLVEQSGDFVEQSKSDEMDETSTVSTVEKFQESNSNPQGGLDSTPPLPKVTTQQTEPAVTDIDSTQLSLEERLADSAASESGAMDVPGNHMSPVEEGAPMETEPSSPSSAAEEVPVAVVEVPAQHPHAEPNATKHPATVVIHDHSYCSQKASSSSLQQPQESSNCSDSLNVATKLSSVNNDHTYCYSSDLDLEQQSSLPDEQTQLEESLLAQPEPICSSPADPDTGTSQELFSCDQNNADETAENGQEEMETLDSNSSNPSSSESHHPDCSQRVATKDTQTPSPELLNTAINTDLTCTTIAVPQLLSVSNFQSVVGEITANTGILAEAGVEELLALQEKLFELQQLVQQSLSKTMRERP